MYTYTMNTYLLISSVIYNLYNLLYYILSLPTTIPSRSQVAPKWLMDNCLTTPGKHCQTAKTLNKGSLTPPKHISITTRSDTETVWPI